MKKLLYLSLITISLLLMACPYEGTVELSSYEESLKVDKKLVGEWVSFHEKGGREELLIEKAVKSVFKVSHNQFGENNKFEQKYNYRVYSTEIGEYDIFNIESPEGKYLYCKYGWTGKNEFYIQFIDADFVDKNFKADSVTTENFKSFVTENVNKEEMYGEKLEFYRKYSPEYEKVRMFMKKSGF
ncbi:MAG: hypothetical protein CO118_01670 [Flavobacteriales bacterium CG_4_9_14_3_um_filter_32_8]|nr:MAG: hypothetical protein CO118_01670 [Flavobacteriales bacterium CG_4_9_14_3_um_filter_32_8]